MGKLWLTLAVSVWFVSFAYVLYFFTVASYSSRRPALVVVAVVIVGLGLTMLLLQMARRRERPRRG